MHFITECTSNGYVHFTMNVKMLKKIFFNDSLLTFSDQLLIIIIIIIIIIIYELIVRNQ